jgi:hypothetical protein
MSDDYHASQTCQITTLSGEPSGLAIHEMKPDGTSLCNQPVRDWNGQSMKFTRRGPGIVNCGHWKVRIR